MSILDILFVWGGLAAYVVFVLLLTALDERTLDRRR
jgi:hypothetical protein